MILSDEMRENDNDEKNKIYSCISISFHIKYDFLLWSRGCKQI